MGLDHTDAEKIWWSASACFVLQAPQNFCFWAVCCMYAEMCGLEYSRASHQWLRQQPMTAHAKSSPLLLSHPLFPSDRLDCCIENIKSVFVWAVQLRSKVYYNVIVWHKRCVVGYLRRSWASRASPHNDFAHALSSGGRILSKQGCPK
jgi:hypothetical protein